MRVLQVDGYVRRRKRPSTSAIRRVNAARPSVGNVAGEFGDPSAAGSAPCWGGRTAAARSPPGTSPAPGRSSGCRGAGAGRVQRLVDLLHQVRPARLGRRRARARPAASLGEDRPRRVRPAGHGPQPGQRRARRAGRRRTGRPRAGRRRPGRSRSLAANGLAAASGSSSTPPTMTMSRLPWTPASTSTRARRTRSRMSSMIASGSSSGVVPGHDGHRGRGPAERGGPGVQRTRRPRRAAARPRSAPPAARPRPRGSRPPARTPARRRTRPHGCSGGSPRAAASLRPARRAR